MPGPNTPYTDLDFQQVIKQAFQESTDRLRVDAAFSGTITVHLDPSTDGVFIGDGTDILNINPDGSINVNLASPIDVNISAAGGDSILSVGTEDGTTTGTQHVLRVANDGTLQVESIQIFTKRFDAITATYPTSTQEVYQSRNGGVAGTVIQTVTVNYTDASKNLILNVART